MPKKEMTDEDLKNFKEMQTKMLTCGDTIHSAVNGLSLATKKMYKAAEDIEARRNDAVNRDNSESALMENGEKLATDEINNRLNEFRNKFLFFKNNIEQNLSTLKLLREYEDNIDILEKHLSDNILEDGEYINKIKSQREINNRLAKYYENKNENLNYYTKYTKYIYFFAIALLTCIVAYISYKRGFFNYILNITTVKNFAQNRIQRGGGSGDNDIINEITSAEIKINQFCRDYSFSKTDRDGIYKKILTQGDTAALLRGFLADYSNGDAAKTKQLLQKILKHISDQNYIRCREGKTLTDSSKSTNELRDLIKQCYDDLEISGPEISGLGESKFSKVYKQVLTAIINANDDLNEKYPIFPIHKDDMIYLEYENDNINKLQKKTIDKLTKNYKDIREGGGSIKNFYKYGKTSTKKSEISSRDQSSRDRSSRDRSSRDRSSRDRSSRDQWSSRDQRSSRDLPSTNVPDIEQKKNLGRQQNKINNDIKGIYSKNATINREIKIIEEKTQNGKRLSTRDLRFLKELTGRKEKNNLKLDKLKKSLNKFKTNAINMAGTIKNTSIETINDPKKMASIILILIIIPLLLKPVIFPLFNLIKHNFIPAPV